MIKLINATYVESKNINTVQKLHSTGDLGKLCLWRCWSKRQIRIKLRYYNLGNYVIHFCFWKNGLYSAPSTLPALFCGVYRLRPCCFFCFVFSGSILKKLLHTGNSFKVSAFFHVKKILMFYNIITIRILYPAMWLLHCLLISFILLWVDTLRGDPSVPAVAAGSEGQLCWRAVPYFCLSGTRISCCALL